jgi:hypothetical protein
MGQQIKVSSNSVIDGANKLINSIVIEGEKQWVARITGLDPKYGLARDFVWPAIKGKQGDTVSWVMPSPGIYQFSGLADDERKATKWGHVLLAQDGNLTYLDGRDIKANPHVYGLAPAPAPIAEPDMQFPVDPKELTDDLFG